MEKVSKSSPFHYRLEPILSPYLQELNNVSNQDPSPHAKPKVDFVFKLLTMLIQSLEPPQNDEQQNNAPAKPNLPVQVLFPQIYPIIKRVAEKWYRDSDVIECMCNLLNQCVQTLQVRTIETVSTGFILVQHLSGFYASIGIWEFAFCPRLD